MNADCPTCHGRPELYTAGICPSCGNINELDSTPPTHPIALPVRAETGTPTQRLEAFLAQMPSDRSGLVDFARMLAAELEDANDASETANGRHGGEILRINTLHSHQAAALSRELEEWKSKAGKVHGQIAFVEVERDALRRELEESRAKVKELAHDWNATQDDLDGANKSLAWANEEILRLRAELEEAKAERAAMTYSSKQATECAGCGKRKHTPLRRDEMGGYVCLTCIDRELDKWLPVHDPVTGEEIPHPTYADIGKLNEELTALRAAPRSETEGRDKERWQQLYDAGKDQFRRSHELLEWLLTEAGQKWHYYRNLEPGARANIRDVNQAAALAHDEKGAGE